MSALPTGTVTFLFTDIEGSARLWDIYPEAMREALSRHNVLIRDAIAAENGIVFKTAGDSFCAAFAAATDALTAALVAQTALMNAQVVPGAPLRVRMALHTGEAHPADGDYADPVLNRVSRLLATAHGGQVILSQATQQMTRDHLPPETALRDLGEHRLKDLQRPEQIFGLFHPALLSEFPPLRSLTRQPNNLPQQTSSFVGRDKDLAEIKIFMTRTRLLTLTGAGGTGKTRLAFQAAADLMAAYPDGVWLAEFASLIEPALALQAVAAALGIREELGRPLLETVTAFLHTKTLLLVLDNCEHLVAFCAQLAETTLRTCPGLKILATSRESLNILGEQIFLVPVLSLPDLQNLPPPEKLLASGAVRLFVDRATAVQPSFALTTQNAAVVAHLCHQLDGIPLCLELAAARIRTFSVEQIAARMNDRFRLLSSGSRTAQPRQRTIETAIEWSDHLLTGEESLLFRRLSVFVGGWTLEAAEEVCSDSVLESYTIFDVLPGLVQKSLVLAETASGETRYRFLETLRQYAWERLLAMSDIEPLRERHRDHYLALAERAEPELRGSEQIDWLNRLERDHDNLRAAIHWSVEPEIRLRLATALHRFWYRRGYMNEGRGWLEGALKTTMPVDISVRAKALNAAGVLAWYQTDYRAARTYQEQALSLYESLDDQEGIARTCINLGMVLDMQQEYSRAQQYFENGLQGYRNLGGKRNIAMALINRASYLIHRDDGPAAAPLLEESRILLQAIDEPWLLATVYYNFGIIAKARQDWTIAYDWLIRCLTIRKTLQDPLGIADCLLPLAKTQQAAGHGRQAAALLGVVEAVHTRIKSPLQEGDAQDARALTQTLMQELGKEIYETAWQRGQAMGAIDAADYVLHKADESPFDEDLR